MDLLKFPVFRKRRKRLSQGGEHGDSEVDGIEEEVDEDHGEVALATEVGVSQSEGEWQEGESVGEAMEEGEGDGGHDDGGALEAGLYESSEEHNSKLELFDDWSDNDAGEDDHEEECSSGAAGDHFEEWVAGCFFAGDGLDVECQEHAEEHGWKVGCEEDFSSEVEFCEQ